MQKRIGSGWYAILAALSAALIWAGAACAESAALGKLKIAYAPPTYEASDWWGKFGENLQSELKKQNADFELLVRIPESHADHGQQFAIIKDFINLKPDFILMGPTELFAQMDAYEEINKAGIPLIILNYTIPFDKRDGVDILSWVGYSHRRGGELAGEWIVEWFKKNKGGKGEMAVLYGNPGSLTQDRYALTSKAIINKELPDVKIVYEGGAEYDRVKAYNAAQNIMTSFPNVDMIYAINSAMAVGALRAVQDAGRDIAVVGWGGVDEEVELVWKGELAACVFRGEYSAAEAVVDIFRKHKNGEEVPEVYITAMGMIDSKESILEQVEPYRLEAMGLKK